MLTMMQFAGEHIPHSLGGNITTLHLTLNPIFSKPVDYASMGSVHKIIRLLASG